MKKIKLIILSLLIIPLLSGCFLLPQKQNQNTNQPLNQNENINASKDIFPLLIGDKNPEEFTFNIAKNEDVFSIGSINSINGGGSIWIAKKIYGNWNIIWQGQEYPLCKILEDNSVPNSIYSGKCFNNDGVSSSDYILK